MAKRKFTVEVEIPEGCTVTEMKEYIRLAVRCWAGGMDPEDPIYDLDKDSVKVSTQRQNTKSTRE